ncbi:hypothetical protein [Eisenbergiella tayi]|uniref:hypothetical protein n=1 Tax=Eisenbergiella tayi TaxID=1432052 RepID=UPI002095F439|nr:hypothetical protein [Eisenbergiella tayi]
MAQKKNDPDLYFCILCGAQHHYAASFAFDAAYLCKKYFGDQCRTICIFSETYSFFQLCGGDEKG